MSCYLGVLHVVQLRKEQGFTTKMGDSSSEEDDLGFLKTPPRLELCKRNNITLTYKRQNWRSKIETGSSRNTNDQELETCTRNHSENVGNDEPNKNEISSLVSKNGEANVPEDVQVTGGYSISTAASTSLAHRKVPKATTPKMVPKATTPKIHVQPCGVPAPKTPDIVTIMQEKRKKPSGQCEPAQDMRQEQYKVSAMEIKQFTPDSKKKSCRRSLNLDKRNLKCKGRNDLMSVETDVSYTDLNIDDNSVSKASVLRSQVQEHVPNMTEKVGDAKVSSFPRTLIVYHRRKKVKNQVKKAKKSSSSLPNELEGLKKTAKKKLAKPVLEMSKHRNSIKIVMTYIHDIFIRKPDNEDQRERQKNVKESFYRQIQLFMSCMHNIQGERKFSQWKGSVMDSIVGAYLAQNVDDVLSSCAFMSLAAKFPREAVSHVEASSSQMRSAKVKKNNAVCSNNVQKGKAAKKDGCSKIRNFRKQRIKKKQDVELVNVLKDCQTKYQNKKKMFETSDSIDWELVRMAKVGDVSKAIQIRGMNNNLAARIKDCLDHLVETFGSTDMEWLLDVPPHKAKEYLMSIYGLGLKTVECIRLLTLRQKAFPIDRNAGRVAVRLGWVPLKQLPEGEEFHFHRIKQYPKLNLIQMYLWQHLSQLEWSILYELHCQMITFGKVFCTERNPGCRECPMKAECKYFTSIRASFELDGKDIEDYGRIKLGNRTEHQVYVLPDGHDILAELESKELDDPCPYLLAVWAPESLEKDECIPEEDAVYGTLMIPVRTATRGMFPLNGTFFQANEVFADDESSEVPLKVPRASLTNLSTTALYCGNSMLQICRGMTSVEVQKCFNRGFACFRGFNQKTREPKPLPARFRTQASKAGKSNKNRK